MVGISITPFVSPWSTTDRMQLYPLLGGRSVIKSIAQFAKHRVLVGPLIGISVGLLGVRLILKC